MGWYGIENLDFKNMSNKDFDMILRIRNKKATELNSKSILELEDGHGN